MSCAGVAAPQDVVAAVAVEVADADDCQLVDDADQRIGVVADEAAIGLAEPVGQLPVVVAPQDVVAAVAVEVADAGDVPAGRR